jgi:hypothetical protein
MDRMNADERGCSADERSCSAGDHARKSQDQAIRSLEKQSVRMSSLSLLKDTFPARPDLEDPQELYKSPARWLTDLKNTNTRSRALENFDLLPDQHKTSTWNKAWNTDLDSASRQALVVRVEALPNSDRLSAYSKILQTSSFVGERPKQLMPDDHGITVATWKALANSANQQNPADWQKQTGRKESDANLQFVLTRLLSYIHPVEESGKCWMQMEKESGRENQQWLVGQLYSLWYDQQKEPYWRAFRNFDPAYLPAIVGAAAPEERLDTLKAVLQMPPSEDRAEILKRTELPEDRPRRLEFMQLCLQNGNAAELRSKDFRDVLTPDKSNIFPKHFSNNILGFSNLTAKLNQDYYWSHLSSNNLGRLGFAGTDPKLARALEQEKDAARDLFFRFAANVRSGQDALDLLNNISRSLDEKSPSQLVMEAASTSPPASDSDITPALKADLAVLAAGDLDGTQVEQLLDKLGKELAYNTTPDAWNVSFNAALTTRLAARGRGEVDAQLLKKFTDPIQKALNDLSLSYEHRQRLARQVALSARESARGLDATPVLQEVILPSAKMPPRFEELRKSGKSREQVRADLEEALKDNDKLTALLGSGELGQLFPDLFGNAEQGGMKGRKQHEGHDYTVDAHTFLVMSFVRSNPEFASLNKYDQRNLLLAALLHDVSKQAGEKDPDHELVSSGWADGFLTTLGYKPEEVSRVATLISRHSDMSYVSSRDTTPDINNPDYVADLTVLYNNPLAVKQLRILNEADIRGVKANSSLWTPETRKFLNHLSEKMAANINNFDRYRLPILTSSLPREFQIYEPKGKYAYYAHSSSQMNKKFWDQMSMIESPNCDLSASLVTDGFGSEIYHDHDLVAILSAPPENLAAAYHGNLGTGFGLNWVDHVKLASSWANDPRAKEIADQLAAGIQKHVLKPGTKKQDTVSLLDDLRRKAAGYNSLDEVLAAEGPSSYLYRAEQELENTMTRKPDGSPLTQFDEVKINNPVVSGLGIYRRGREVSLEGVSSREQLQDILGMKTLPNWLVAARSKTGNEIVIPQRIWTEARKKHIPFVMLDNQGNSPVLEPDKIGVCKLQFKGVHYASDRDEVEPGRSRSCVAV